MKLIRPPDLKSSSNVSLPFAWITGPCKQTQLHLVCIIEFVHYVNYRLFLAYKEKLQSFDEMVIRKLDHVLVLLNVKCICLSNSTNRHFWQSTFPNKHIHKFHIFFFFFKFFTLMPPGYRSCQILQFQFQCLSLFHALRLFLTPAFVKICFIVIFIRSSQISK